MITIVIFTKTLKFNATNYNLNYDSKNKNKIKWVSSYMRKEKKNG